MRKKRHPLSGAIYTAGDDGTVTVEKDGHTGVFTSDGRWLSGDLFHADPHLCQWLAGRQLPAGMVGSQRDLPTRAASPATASS